MDLVEEFASLSAYFTNRMFLTLLVLTATGSLLFFLPAFTEKRGLRYTGLCMWLIPVLIIFMAQTAGALLGLVVAISWQLRQSYDKRQRKNFERRNARLHSG